jgi:hypothetical protein
VCCVGRHAAGNFRSTSASNTTTTAHATASGPPQYADEHRPSVRSSSQAIGSSPKCG